METLTISDIIDIIKRRYLLFLAPTMLGVLVSLIISQALPSIYASTARILVESQVIPSDLAQSTVNQSVAERIALIRQRLLTRNNLLDIANSFEIYSDRPAMSPTDIVTAMRRDSTIEGNEAGQRGRRTVTGITITFRSESPQLAAAVANELVSRVLQQNVEQRTNTATGTLAFFDAEVDRLSAQLDSLSQRITDFKIANQDALPSSLSIRQRDLSTLRDRAFSRAATRSELENQLELAQRQLEIGVADSSGASQELGRLRGALVQQKAVLADTHPTIRQLEARIAALEAAREGGADTGRAIGTRQGAATELLSRIETLEDRLAILDDQEEAEQAQIAQLEASIERTPQVELTLDGLQRDIRALQAQYDEALLKRARAETGERLESNQQAERFEIIEQALPPDGPVSPNRPLVVVVGSVLSMGLAGLFVILAEALNNSIRTARDLERRMNLQPIAVVPYIRNRRQELTKRWVVRLLVLFTIGATALAIYLVDQYVLPLPLIIERIIERTGLDNLLVRLGM
jgi:polysaccharide chain length determinant protein (PEP-CTERM system associated)